MYSSRSLKIFFFIIFIKQNDFFKYLAEYIWINYFLHVVSIHVSNLDKFWMSKCKMVAIPFNLLGKSMLHTDNSYIMIKNYTDRKLRNIAFYWHNETVFALWHQCNVHLKNNDKLSNFFIFLYLFQPKLLQ